MQINKQSVNEFEKAIVQFRKKPENYAGVGQKTIGKIHGDPGGSS